MCAIAAVLLQPPVYCEGRISVAASFWPCNSSCALLPRPPPLRRPAGLSVSQARLLSVYRGSAEPANLTSSAPLTRTEDAPPSTTSDSLTAADSALDGERASQGLAPWQVAITAVSLLGAAAVTGRQITPLFVRLHRLLLESARSSPPASVPLESRRYVALLLHVTQTLVTCPLAPHCVPS